MKKLVLIIISLCCGVTIYLMPSLHASDGIAASCQERCQAFQGMSKYNCISRCTKFSKHNSNNSGSTSTVKEHYQQCSEICKQFKGIKNVQCMRVCLDRIKVPDRKDPNNIQNYSQACQNRCRNMPDKYKFKCLQRCKKSEETGGQNSGSGSTKVW